MTNPNNFLNYIIGNYNRYAHETNVNISNFIELQSRFERNLSRIIRSEQESQRLQTTERVFNEYNEARENLRETENDYIAGRPTRNSENRQPYTGEFHRINEVLNRYRRRQNLSENQETTRETNRESRRETNRESRRETPENNEAVNDDAVNDETDNGVTDNREANNVETENNETQNEEGSSDENTRYFREQRRRFRSRLRNRSDSETSNSDNLPNQVNNTYETEYSRNYNSPLIRSRERYDQLRRSYVNRYVNANSGVNPTSDNYTETRTRNSVLRPTRNSVYFQSNISDDIFNNLINNTDNTNIHGNIGDHLQHYTDRPTNRRRSVVSQLFQMNPIQTNLVENTLNTVLTTLSPVPVRPTARQIAMATEIIQFNQNDSNNEQTSCPIDLQQFEPEENVMRIISCGHIFRENNLIRWFSNNVRCPLCRYDIREYNPLTSIRNPYRSSAEIRESERRIHSNRMSQLEEGRQVLSDNDDNTEIPTTVTTTSLRTSGPATETATASVATGVPQDTGTTTTTANNIGESPLPGNSILTPGSNETSLEYLYGLALSAHDREIHEESHEESDVEMDIDTDTENQLHTNADGEVDHEVDHEVDDEVNYQEFTEVNEETKQEDNDLETGLNTNGNLEETKIESDDSTSDSEL